MRALATMLAAACALACPRTVRGDGAAPSAKPTNEAECEAVFKRALELADHGQIASARDELERCESVVCGDVVRRRCMLRGELLAVDAPTIVLSVTDDDDAPITDVRVLVDGRELAAKLDGRAVAIDPGMRELTFQRAGATFATKKLFILQGQRNRVVAVRMQGLENTARHAAAAAHASALRLDAAATPKRGSYLPSYLVLGAGAIGIGGAALLTMWGRGDNERLAECSPNCPQASVDHIHHLYLAADISLGVGLASVAIGSWLAWRTHSHYAVSVQPTASGAVASLTGAL